MHTYVIRVIIANNNYKCTKRLGEDFQITLNVNMKGGIVIWPAFQPLAKLMNEKTGNEYTND